MLARFALRMALLVGAFVSVVWAAGPLPDVKQFGSDGPGGGFAQVLEPRVFEFPRDHGPHPEYRQEWWYVTGNLDSASGERFGFELTFFRFALAPGGVVHPASAPQGAGGAQAAQAVSAGVESS